MKERSCNGCTKCCQGHLVGDAYGHKFFKGRPCFFFSTECTIYETRPENPCRVYKCGWLDELQFPEWMKPDLVNVIINRSSYKDIKYYALVESGSLLNVKVLSWMIHWALNNNQNLLYFIDGGVNRIGSKEFLEAPI